MACAVLTLGTTNRNDCTGPLNALIVAGVGVVVQLSVNTIGIPMATGAPALSGVQVGTGPLVESHAGSAGMYDRFCRRRVPLKSASMIVHEPVACQTSVTGVVSCRRALPSSFTIGTC